MQMPSFTHAGGIVLRRDADVVRVLVVRPSSGPDNGDHDVWVLPKGHIEPGEDPPTAALREVTEESGVIGAEPEYVGCAEYRAKGEDVVCAFYLMRQVGDGPAEEERERAWLTVEELRVAMPYEGTMRLVERAAGG